MFDFENRSVLGIPEGYAFPTLLYNPPTETLILEARSRDKVWRPHRLFMRHKDAEKYTQIGNPDKWTSYEHPVTSITQPLLVFNVLTCRKHEEGIGCDWKELNVLDIKTGILKHSIQKDELVLPEECKGWISGLLAISDDGERIYVDAGLEKIEKRDTSGMLYYLATLDLNSKRVEPISLLKGTFL